MEFQKAIELIEQHTFSPVYLVQGKERFLQEWARSTFLEQVVLPEDRDLNVGRFNMEEVSIQTAIADAEMVPFFGERRLVMIDKPYFLTGEREKNKMTHQIDVFQRYLEHPVESTILVIFAPYEKLDSRKKIVKKLKNTAVLIDASPLNEKEVYRLVAEKIMSQQLQIDPKTLTFFLEKTNYSLTFSMTELEKLCLSAMDTGMITKEMVENLVSRSLEQNIFEITEATLQKKAAYALQLYHDLLLQKEEPVKMNALLLGQFRLLIQVGYLLKEGYREPEMQKMLGVHPYRIKLALQQVRQFNIRDLERAYDYLVEIDEALKTGKGIKEMQFELFLLQFCN